MPLIYQGHLGFNSMAGYSSTPLQKKLGLKEDQQLYIYQPPAGYFDWIAPMPKNCTIKTRLSGELDFVHLFVVDEKVLQMQFVRCKQHLKKTGMMWISWPKKTAKLPTNLDGNIVRELGLKNGLVDVKVCAVNDVWSGLKFMFRVKDRLD